MFAARRRAEDHHVGQDLFLPVAVSVSGCSTKPSENVVPA